MLCLYSPLWWGVVDLREERVAPSPDLPHAKHFLPDTEVSQLQQLAANIVKEESHINSLAVELLEALLSSKTIGLKTLAKEYGAYGVVGVCKILGKEHILKDFDAYDDDAIYIGKCLSAA